MFLVQNNKGVDIIIKIVQLTCYKFVVLIIEREMKDDTDKKLNIFFNYIELIDSIRTQL